MKKFKNPIAPTIPDKKVKSPWDFTSLCDGERSKISAGSNYGIGHRVPVGHFGNPKLFSNTLPFGRPDTKRVDNISADPLEVRGSLLNSKPKKQD